MRVCYQFRDASRYVIVSDRDDDFIDDSSVSDYEENRRERDRKRKRFKRKHSRRKITERHNRPCPSCDKDINSTQAEFHEHVNSCMDEKQGKPSEAHQRNGGPDKRSDDTELSRVYTETS